MKKIYSRDDVKIYEYSDEGALRYAISDWLDYFIVVREVESLKEAKQIAKALRDGTFSLEEAKEKYTVLDYKDIGIKLIPSKIGITGSYESAEEGTRGITFPLTATSSPTILAHELGHALDKEAGPFRIGKESAASLDRRHTAGEERAWKFAIPRLKSTGSWNRHSKQLAIKGLTSHYIHKLYLSPEASLEKAKEFISKVEEEEE